MTTQNLYQKTLSEQMTPNEFLWHVRRDPQYTNILTNVMSFEDTIKSLKSKGYIWETTQTENLIKPTDFIGSFKKLNEAASKKQKLKGGKGDKLIPDQVNYYEFRKGWKHELEHTDDIDKAKEIALDHLAEDPIYYTRLEMIETKAKKDSRNDLPIDISKKNRVVKDEKNQMSPAKKTKKETSNVSDSGKQERARSKTAGIKKMKGGSGEMKSLREEDQKRAYTPEYKVKEKNKKEEYKILSDTQLKDYLEDSNIEYVDPVNPEATKKMDNYARDYEKARLSYLNNTAISKIEDYISKSKSSSTTVLAKPKEKEGGKFKIITPDKKSRLVTLDNTNYISAIKKNGVDKVIPQDSIAEKIVKDNELKKDPNIALLKSKDVRDIKKKDLGWFKLFYKKDSDIAAAREKTSEKKDLTYDDLVSWYKEPDIERIFPINPDAVKMMDKLKAAGVKKSEEPTKTSKSYLYQIPETYKKINYAIRFDGEPKKSLDIRELSEKEFSALSSFVKGSPSSTVKTKVTDEDKEKRPKGYDAAMAEMAKIISGNVQNVLISEEDYQKFLKYAKRPPADSLITSTQKSDTDKASQKPQYSTVTKSTDKKAEYVPNFYSGYKYFYVTDKKSNIEKAEVINSVERLNQILKVAYYIRCIAPFEKVVDLKKNRPLPKFKSKKEKAISGDSEEAADSARSIVYKYREFVSKSGGAYGRQVGTNIKSTKNPSGVSEPKTIQFDNKKDYDKFIANPKIAELLREKDATKKSPSKITSDDFESKKTSAVALYYPDPTTGEYKKKEEMDITDYMLYRALSDKGRQDVDSEISNFREKQSKIKSKSPVLEKLKKGEFIVKEEGQSPNIKTLGYYEYVDSIEKNGKSNVIPLEGDKNAEVIVKAYKADVSIGIPDEVDFEGKIKVKVAGGKELPVLYKKVKSEKDSTSKTKEEPKKPEVSLAKRSDYITPLSKNEIPSGAKFYVEDTKKKTIHGYSDDLDKAKSIASSLNGKSATPKYKVIRSAEYKFRYLMKEGKEGVDNNNTLSSLQGKSLAFTIQDPKNASELVQISNKVVSANYNKGKKELTISMGEGAKLVFTADASGSPVGVYFSKGGESKDSNQGAEVPQKVVDTKDPLTKILTTVYPKPEPTSNEAQILEKYIRERIRKALREGDEGPNLGAEGPDVVKKKLIDYMQRYSPDWNTDPSPKQRSIGAEYQGIIARLVSELNDKEPGLGTAIYKEYTGKALKGGQADQATPPPSTMAYDPTKLISRGGRIAEEFDAAKEAEILKNVQRYNDVNSQEFKDALKSLQDYVKALGSTNIGKDAKKAIMHVTDLKKQ